MRSSVLESFTEYLEASFTLDASRVAEFYDEPFMFVAAARAVTAATRTEAEALLEPGFAVLRDSGYVRTDSPTLRSKSLGAGLAIISGVGVRYASDGSQMATFGSTYLWRKALDGWKLAVMTVHEPSAVLTLD